MKKKFRAFYGPDMDTPDGALKFQQVEKDGKLYFQYEDLIYEFYIPFVDKDWTIQQYVGVDDINGKEIYEGDIVIYAGSLLYEIQWDILYMRFLVSTITNQDGMYQLTPGELKQSKVIGNIFETPHLLK